MDGPRDEMNSAELKSEVEGFTPAELAVLNVDVDLRKNLATRVDRLRLLRVLIADASCAAQFQGLLAPKLHGRVGVPAVAGLEVQQVRGARVGANVCEIIKCV